MHKWYNASIRLTAEVFPMGLTLSSTLDVNKLDQQAACQRYRHFYTIAEEKLSAREAVANLLNRSFAPAVA